MNALSVNISAKSDAIPSKPSDSEKKSSIWKQLKELQKAHGVALTAFAMMATLAVIFTSVEREWLKFFLLNGVAVMAKEVNFCRIGVADGISLGYLTRGVHNLALALLGDFTALPSGLFWTFWAINIKDYI